MKRITTALAVGAIALLGALAVSRPVLALTIALSPSAATLPLVGDDVAVDVIVSGVAVPPSVGAFDLDLTFDPAVLAPTDIAFGSALGDPDLFEAIVDSNVTGGVIDLSEVSLLDQGFLDALQAGGSFVLATITFEGVGAGESLLELAQADVFDGEGDLIAIDANLGSAITVVPEPATATLFAAALAALAAARRRG